MTDITLWNGKTIPRLGMGCWAIGGEFWAGDQALGWGKVNDDESIAAIRRAVELGIRCFDTANVYGCGHSEEILAEALSVFDDDIVVSTKLGNGFDVASKQAGGIVDDPAGVRAAIDASLKRLRRERIDLVFFHINEHPVEASQVVFETLAALRREGKVDAFGWSTDDPESAAHFADMDGFKAIQHDMNLFTPANSMLPVLDAHDLCSMARQPLAMGLLSGRFKPGQKSFETADIRADGPQWLSYFVDGAPNPTMLEKVEAMRALLASDGRSVAQGALAWIWAKSPRVIPIPGFRTVQQVEQNAGALDKGPLPSETVRAIDDLVAGRETV